MKYIVNLSGGKDSTALLLILLERGAQVDYIVFADTGKDFPQMSDHIDKLRDYIKANFPTAPEITVLRSEKSFDYLMFDHVRTRGKNKGQKGYGWASMLARWCTSELKARVIDNFLKSLNDDYTQYIGIAADEPKRLYHGNAHMRYPLADWGVTEAAALQYCYEHGFDWGGLYNHFDRVSCWCCPLKNLRELKTLWRYYPELWAELRRMDERSCNRFRADYSVAELEERFAREAAAQSSQMCFCDLKEAETMTDKKTCCICGKPIEGYGNNPAPVMDGGECCDKCNADVVLPIRLAQVVKARTADDIKTVYIPACDGHDGVYGMYVKLRWVCPICGQPRGQIKNVRSYDGSRVLTCDGWDNPCGHIDKYDACRKEAAENGLNAELAAGGGK